MNAVIDKTKIENNKLLKKNRLFKETSFDFELPKLLECAIPTEVRGLARDEVKLMVSHRINDAIEHRIFNEIGEVLKAGDVLVVNTSKTINAAVPMVLPNGKAGRVHLATKLSETEYLVEVRQVVNNKTKRFHGIQKGQEFVLADNATMKIIAPYYEQENKPEHIQLWKVEFSLPTSMTSYLNRNAQAISYSNVDKKYPISFYQTCFANPDEEWGSAEMPSAGRAFTPELVNQLKQKGVEFAPVLLHTGISSLETHEKPYPELFRVSTETAHLLNVAKSEGRRIIAVGTTAIRAVESAVNNEGIVEAAEGMTDLFITQESGLNLINGMLTGFHEPKASHLLMMEALANRSHLEQCYQAAIPLAYQWHEFGDLHLIL